MAFLVQYSLTDALEQGWWMPEQSMWSRVEERHLIVKRLTVPFAVFMWLVAACSPSILPAPTSNAPVVAQQPSQSPTPTALSATHTLPLETASPSQPGSTSLPQPTETPTPDTRAILPPTDAATRASALEVVACDGTFTPAQTEGPFYTPDTPERADLVETGMGGTPLLVTGQVLNQDCEPVPGAKLDFWQADDNGEYDNVGYRMRGHQLTDAKGNYALETILPGRYPGRTPHIHVKVFAPDGREVLTTQIYLPGISDQVPDGIFSPELLARDLPSDVNGRRHVAFDFIVRD